MKTSKSRGFVFAFAISFILAIGSNGFLPLQANGQKPVIGEAYSAIAPQTLSLKSRLMAREMPYRIILPGNYKSQAKTRFPVVYLLHGLDGHYDNWTDKTKVTEYARKYNLIIITPEGNNGWYTDSISTPNDKYESYIIQELIPEIDAKFHTLADRDHRIIAGLSMGGYGAVKFGLKYADKFSIVGSFSGALGAATVTDNMGTRWRLIGDTINSTFGKADSDARKANDVFRLIDEMTSENAKSLPFIYISCGTEDALSCGTEDALIQSNHDFLALLNRKRIPHEYREHPGAHNWVFWDDQVREFLAVTDRMIKK